MRSDSSNSENGSQLDLAFEDRQSRFLIGIDLGTTNCAVAYVDTSQSNLEVEIFGVEQMVDIQTRQRSDTLPSFHYELTQSEAAEIDPRFVFDNEKHRCVVGVYARQRGMQMPGRCVASAKSWLCHPMVDRTSELLPWDCDDDIRRVSPVQASSRYLEHIRRMWDRDHPNDLMSDQEVIVTLPASFDEVARQLTIQAAKEAGITNIVLIEEPQAAFYAWLNRNLGAWQEQIRPGQSILVCDIGGGTTDFTLIRVISSTTSDSVEQSELDAKELDLSQNVNQKLRDAYGLHRVAVGEHLMLGGDNLDLALARGVEQRLLADMPGVEQLRPRQWDALKTQCRIAKEMMLGSSPPTSYALSLPGSGSKLIENTRTVPIDRDWVHEVLVDGFFGKVEIHDRPKQEQSGFQEFGLPYAVEPNVNRHLAAFLWDHRWDGRQESDRDSMSDLVAARPDWVLFNGGVLESIQIRNAILSQIAYWFRDTPNTNTAWKPGILDGNRLDLAVAQGAAYFGLVRRGHGVRIDARLARTYYLQISDSPPTAFCIMPANALPLDRHRMDQHPFELTVGQPVQFPLWQSSTQLVHKVGQIVPVDPQCMTALPPIRTVLEARNRKQLITLPVVLESEISEIGTLAIRLVTRTLGEEESATWNLEFDVRGSISSDGDSANVASAISETSNSSQINLATQAIVEIFGTQATVLPKEGLNVLAARIGVGRRDWTPSILRAMWKSLMENQEYRKRSAEHEARWLNLTGWCLRPGFGVAADDWRVNATWRCIHNKLIYRNASNASEAIVLWRRISGGFTAGQQRALFQDSYPKLRSAISGGAQNQSPSVNVTIELLRLVGSLEWLTQHEKDIVAEMCLSAICKKKLESIHSAALWCLGRIGSRVPVYATLQQVMNAGKAQTLIDRLLSLNVAVVAHQSQMYSLCLMQLSRRTNDRYRDVVHSTRERVLRRLSEIHAPAVHLELVEQGGQLDEENATSIVGESLPLGFRLAGK